MIFFIYTHLAEQNAGICSPNMIIDDNFDAGIIIYALDEYGRRGLVMPVGLSNKRKLLKLPYPENLLRTLWDGIDESIEVTPDIQAGLEYAITKLTKVEQEVLRLRFQERLTYVEIGEVRGKTGHGACATENNAMRKLRRTALRGYIQYGKEGFEAIDCVLYPPGVNPQPATGTTDPQLLLLPFEKIDLSVGAFNTLRRAGYEFVGDIVDLSYDQILQINRLSRKRIEEIAVKLQYIGVRNTAWREFLR